MLGQDDDRTGMPEQLESEDENGPTPQVDQDREPTVTDTPGDTMSGNTGSSGGPDTGTGGTGLEERSTDGSGGMTGLTGTTSDETRS